MNGGNNMARIAPRYHDLIRVIGEDATRKLCQEFGGDSLYIPKEDRLLTAERAEKIIDEWNGHNTHKLARKYGLSRRMIQLVVQGRRIPEVKGQVSMLECFGERDHL